MTLLNLKGPDHFLRGYIHQIEGRTEVAVRDFTSVIRQEASKDAYLQRGIAFAALGNDKSAISDLTTALVHQRSVEASIARSAAYSRIGDEPRAAADLSEAANLQTASSWQTGSGTSLILGDKVLGKYATSAEPEFQKPARSKSTGRSPILTAGEGALMVIDVVLLGDGMGELDTLRNRDNHGILTSAVLSRPEKSSFWPYGYTATVSWTDSSSMGYRRPNQSIPASLMEQRLVLRDGAAGAFLVLR
jgi:tetratricopeptide (TPR) repeat protein